MHTHHLSLCEAAVKFKIPTEVTVMKWERIYQEEGREGLLIEKRGRKNIEIKIEPRKQKAKKEPEENLIAELQRLRMENAYLKKLNALVQERIQRENGKK
jgi:transposase